MQQPTPPRHYGGDPQLQENVQDLQLKVSNLPFLDGQLVTIQLVGGQATKVAHGLNRTYQGWIVVRTNTANREMPTEDYDSTDKDLFLTLTVTATHTVTLWVF